MSATTRPYPAIRANLGRIVLAHSRPRERQRRDAVSLASRAGMLTARHKSEERLSLGGSAAAQRLAVGVSQKTIIAMRYDRLARLTNENAFA